VFIDLAWQCHGRGAQHLSQGNPNYYAPRNNRKGQHSIRINDQWRVCFVWSGIGPVDVEIVDYH
jgi:plasmid maintenance system killer protein